MLNFGDRVYIDKNNIGSVLAFKYDYPTKTISVKVGWKNGGWSWIKQSKLKKIN